MPKLEWLESFELRVPEIDGDHRTMLDLMKAQRTLFKLRRRLKTGSVQSTISTALSPFPNATSRRKMFCLNAGTTPMPNCTRNTMPGFWSVRRR